MLGHFSPSVNIEILFHFSLKVLNLCIAFPQLVVGRVDASFLLVLFRFVSAHWLS